METNKQFDELLARYSKLINRERMFAYERARDKSAVKEKLDRETSAMFDALMRPAYKEKLFFAFIRMYREGEYIVQILLYLKANWREVEGIHNPLFLDAQSETPVSPEEAKQIIEEFVGNSKKLMRFFVKATALFQLKWPFEEEAQLKIQSTALKSELRWTSPNDTKNEFVQLVYALHRAGYINQGKGEITKIVESLAGHLNLDLGKNWQSNHSASIHKSKRDYFPPIFGTLKDAYESYINYLIIEKKKNS